MGTAIEVRGLRKRYGDVEAVQGIDLDVDQGEILAFLGPNGAGKTTTIEILEGYRDRDGGEVSVLGVDPARAPLSWRDDIGIVLQESEPLPELTALESVVMHAAYYDEPRDPGEVLDIVGLADSADQRTRKLSGGQRRRLDLALALVGNPRLVFLDEPTTGFDPSARRESWHMIEALRQLGSTVLLTTHYMDEADHLADRIVVIAGGRIAARGTAAELADEVGVTPSITWRTRAGAPAPPDRLGAVADDAGRGVITTEDIVPVVNALTAWALDDGVELLDLTIRRPTLEDVYLALTDGVDPGGAVMAAIARLAHQTRFDILVFRRNPAATFFTIVLPLIFLVIFTSIFGNQELGNGARAATFYVPGILALAIVSATTVNLAITMTARRERGVLKRVRGTPIPPWVFVAAQAIAALVISVTMTVVIVVVGRALYGVSLAWSAVPSLAITVGVGAMSFAAVGLALTAIIPSEDAAPAVTNAIMLPLYFISDVFIVGDQVPAWLRTTAAIFPVRHLANALQDSFNPFFDGTPWPWQHWLVIAAWGLFGVVATLTWFRWTPRR